MGRKIESSTEYYQERKPTRFVVVREGHRVSPHEYDNPKDPQALEEVKFWQNIATKYSWGEPVEIVRYDNKLHRVWGEPIMQP